MLKISNVALTAHNASNFDTIGNWTIENDVITNETISKFAGSKFGASCSHFRVLSQELARLANLAHPTNGRFGFVASNEFKDVVQVGLGQGGRILAWPSIRLSAR